MALGLWESAIAFIGLMRWSAMSDDKPLVDGLVRSIISPLRSARSYGVYTSRKNLTLAFSVAKIFPSPYQGEGCPELPG
jgi:hypothetical protein